MYKDPVQWARVRAQVFAEGQSISKVSKAEHIARGTVRKMLLNKRPPKGQQKRPKKLHSFQEEFDTLNALIAENEVRKKGVQCSSKEILNQLYAQGYSGTSAAVRYHIRHHEDTYENHLWDVLQRILRTLPELDARNLLTSLFPQGTLTQNNAAAQRRLNVIQAIETNLKPMAIAMQHWESWLAQLERNGVTRTRNLDSDVVKGLSKELLPIKEKERKKALVILAHDRGFPMKHVARFLGIGICTARHYVEEFSGGGLDRLFGNKPKPKKSDDENINKEVFALLHEPPSLAGLNRTTWRITDLEQVLKAKGLSAGHKIIQKIIKDGGYRWRAARIVLTSNDPTYKEKIAHIEEVLGSLQEDERFFSIDEFGPFTVNMKGGRRLAAPGLHPTVPQRQSSKGKLILTAALELSRNQVSHFYSTTKNTIEMIKLAQLLTEEYSAVKKLYLSWDAAAWHSSLQLNNFIAEHNANAECKKLPKIEVIPLPANAQFLNVIESVFSGMARAIMHNSDYQSVDDAKHAVDLYFAERNRQFLQFPRRAGNKIWGLEETVSEFAVENNCKNPNYR
jgi:transposase